MLYVCTNYNKCFNILKNNHFNLITVNKYGLLEQ